MAKHISLDAIESNRDEAPDYRSKLKADPLGAPVGTDDRMYRTRALPEEEGHVRRLSEAMRELEKSTKAQAVREDGNFCALGTCATKPSKEEFCEFGVCAAGPKKAKGAGTTGRSDGR
ncbi:MAG: hypothetical protein V1813_01585 [Candidatus Aenigmatarchaeota archaeon]